MPKITAPPSESKARSTPPNTTTKPLKRLGGRQRRVQNRQRKRRPIPSIRWPPYLKGTGWKRIWHYSFGRIMAYRRSPRNFLVLDCGIFTSLANALSMDGKNKVYYHTNWSGDAFPKLQDFAPGTGFDNLIKIKRLYTEIDFTAKDHPTVDETGDKIDCVICFDVGRNDEIDDIRRRYPNLIAW